MSFWIFKEEFQILWNADNCYNVYTCSIMFPFDVKLSSDKLIPLMLYGGLIYSVHCEDFISKPLLLKIEIVSLQKAVVFTSSLLYRKFFSGSLP